MPRNPRPAIGIPSHGGAVSNPVARNRSWWPAFTVTFLTAVYALGYLLWERGAWGSPAVRDLVELRGFIEYRDDDAFDIAMVQMRIKLPDPEDQFRFRHRSCPQDCRQAGALWGQKCQSRPLTSRVSI